MKLLLNQMTVLRNGGAERVSVLVEDGRIVSLSKETPDAAGARVIELDHGYLFPGFVDVHVHLREPGFSYKETIATGTRAAAHGGYTAVCPMPNLKPVPDSLENLQPELDAIAKDAVIHVHPYGAITVGEKGKELADLEAMAPYVVAFSDDGKGVQNPEMMKQAMLRAKALGKIIVAHCEDESLLNSGYIHDGEYAKAHGHRGNPSASEWKQVERDLDLVRETGCAYHVCHVSTKETVALIRKAKAEGLDVTCETTPHYLVFNDSMLREEGCFKMNPPIRSEGDRQALIAGILDGTVDMIATDHAPHSAEEKGRGLAHSLFGIVGLETAFPVLYTELVKPGVLTLEQLIDRMVTKPAQRFGIGSALEEGAPADLTVFDLDASYTIQPEDFLSMGKSSPFAGRTVFGKCLLTLSGGEIAWQEEGGKGL
ncbi:MAG: dihydroorotase [Evtepia sp.]